MQEGHLRIRVSTSSRQSVVETLSFFEGRIRNVCGCEKPGSSFNSFSPSDYTSLLAQAVIRRDDEVVCIRCRIHVTHCSRPIDFDCKSGEAVQRNSLLGRKVGRQGLFVTESEIENDHEFELQAA